MEVSDGRREAIRRYYLRDDIVEVMVDTAAYREFAPTYPGGYGSRPDAITYPEDFRAMVDDGAIAFHGSVELWRNPMLIDSVDNDKLRTGWDLVMDIDADEGMVFAKMAAEEVIGQLKRYGITEDCISVKFSGNRGFHIGVRGEVFPSSIGGTDRSDLYPRLPQAIVGFIRDSIADRLAERIVAEDGSLADVVEEDGPFAVADVENDWGDRHLFRMPYSVNEKSWLVSLPIQIDDIWSFEKDDARMEDVSVDAGFLDGYEDNVGADLAVEALDALEAEEKHSSSERRESYDADYERPDGALDDEWFPAPIKRIMAGLEDGRKRALFILITFLHHVGYDWDAVANEIWEWNDRNAEPLPERYVEAQLRWHRQQDDPLMPPNFDKDVYKDVGVLDVEEDKQMIENFDNPVPYAFVLRDKGRDGEGNEDD